MKKSGFTLAEVLITLGIIGVVAALTAPSLVTSGQSQANAARLAVTVSNLENAFTNAIVQEGASDIYGTQMWQGTIENSDSVSESTIKKFAGQMGKYIHLNGFSKQDMNAFYGAQLKENGSEYDGDKMSNGPFHMSTAGTKGSPYTLKKAAIPIILKNGAVIFISLEKTADGYTEGSGETAKTYTKEYIIQHGGSLYNKAGEIIIDVNGKSAPNVIGRDIFRFFLGSNGILYPDGGLDASLYYHGDDTHTWKGETSGSNCTRGDIQDDWNCTARVIEEGYKINY